jgi:hypothetical protein
MPVVVTLRPRRGRSLPLRIAIWIMVVICVVVLTARGDDLQSVAGRLFVATGVAVVVCRRILRTT